MHVMCGSIAVCVVLYVELLGIEVATVTVLQLGSQAQRLCHTV